MSVLPQLKQFELVRIHLLCFQSTCWEYFHGKDHASFRLRLEETAVEVFASASSQHGWGGEFSEDLDAIPARFMHQLKDVVNMVRSFLYEESRDPEEAKAMIDCMKPFQQKLSTLLVGWDRQPVDANPNASFGGKSFAAPSSEIVGEIEPDVSDVSDLVTIQDFLLATGGHSCSGSAKVESERLQSGRSNGQLKKLGLSPTSIVGRTHYYRPKSLVNVLTNSEVKVRDDDGRQIHFSEEEAKRILSSLMEDSAEGLRKDCGRMRKDKKSQKTSRRKLRL